VSDNSYVFTGYVTDYDQVRQTYTVHDTARVYTNVLDGSGICSAFLGLKRAGVIPVGSRVVGGFCENRAYITGGVPADCPDEKSFLSRTITGTGFPGAVQKLHPQEDGDGKFPIPQHNMPGDLYEGEFEHATLTGSFIRFLLFMASMGGSERAKIEFHLLRDLVRIVAGNYEHFGPLGDIKMFNDGRNSMEVNFTGFEHERWGRLSPKDPKYAASDTKFPENLDPLETGRWRLTMLIGFLGDVVNGWVTDPCSAIAKMTDATGQYRSGKARWHVGEDGTILLQSCADIVLERVVRIPVPIRIKHEEDPSGVIAKEMDSLDRTFLKHWDQKKGETEHHTAYQIREYVRYLNSYHSLARLLQLEVEAQGGEKAEWKLPSENATPAPKMNCDAEDKKQANASLTYYKDCYSTIRVMRDGSILLYDAYGNAVVTGPPGIQLSSMRHIRFCAAGDITMQAGSSVFIRARRHIEVAAERGSLILKARTAWRALCERGTLWIKSDYDSDNPYEPESGDPAPEVFAPQGIRIQATSAEAHWISKLKTFIWCKGTDAGKKGDLDMLLEGKLTAQINEKELPSSFKQGKLVATANPDGTLSLGLTDLAIRAKTIVLDGIANLTRQAALIFSQLIHGGSLKLDGSAQVTGMVSGSNAPDLAKSDPGAPGVGDAPTVDVDSPPDQKPESGSPWATLPAPEYTWPGKKMHGKTDADTLFEPLSQQDARLDAETYPASQYADWEGATQKLLEAEETNSKSAPWPGNDAKWLQHASGGSPPPTLHKPTDKTPNEFPASVATPLTKKPINPKYLKR
jgi:hypothetical protein